LRKKFGFFLIKVNNFSTFHLCPFQCLLLRSQRAFRNKAEGWRSQKAALRALKRAAKSKTRHEVGKGLSLLLRSAKQKSKGKKNFRLKDFRLYKL
jgi:hypothetical protein